MTLLMAKVASNRMKIAWVPNQNEWVRKVACLPNLGKIASEPIAEQTLQNPSCDFAAGLAAGSSYTQVSVVESYTLTAPLTSSIA